MYENPIALRSKNKLMQALDELMQQKPYSDITITELCEKAGLSRPAFYQNFGKLDNVLKRRIEEMLRDAIDKESLKENPNANELANAYIDAIEANIDFYKIVFENNLMAFVIEKSTWVFASMPQTSGNLPNADDETKQYYSAFVAAGVSTVLSNWIYNGMQLDKQKLVSILEQAIEGQAFK